MVVIPRAWLDFDGGRTQTPMHTRAHRALTAVVLGAAVLTTAACSGGSASAGPEPERARTPVTSPSTHPSSPAPSETTPSPSPTARPLSRFEGAAPVKATRTLAAALGRAVNQRQRDIRLARPFLTAHGARVVPGYMAEDYGRYYPGPNPFTPTSVTVHGRRASVTVCWQGGGWAQKRASGLPAEKRDVFHGTIYLRKQQGRWKVDDMLYSPGSCAGVRVKGVAW